MILESKIIVIDSKSLEQDAGGKPVSSSSRSSDRECGQVPATNTTMSLIVRHMPNSTATTHGCDEAEGFEAR